MLFSVVGIEAGATIDCGPYGSVINGEIEREEHVVFLQATHHRLIDAATSLPATMITWHSPNFGVGDGYGSSAEHMMLALEQRGYDVRVEPRWNVVGQTHIKHILEREYANGSVRIAYTPARLPAWGRRVRQQAVLGFTMWEDSEVPHSFDEAFFEADVIAAPSQFCQRLFQNRLAQLGIPTNVHYVPLGVNVDGCPVRKRTFDGRETFTVIHTATRSSEERKGADVAIKAFQKAFRSDENVRLLLRSRLNEFPEAVASDMRIVPMPGAITDEQRAEIYHRAHVLLYPSRGEGFGLIPLEALATGLPAIVSDGSAMTDYRDLFYPIAVYPSPSKIAVAVRPEPAGDWHEPDIDSAAAQLRHVYANYETAAARAIDAAAIIRRDWTYERSGRALAAAVEEARMVVRRELGEQAIFHDDDLVRHAVAHGA
jgi:glycosyltransferase involved in cell wall biosynthesis